MALKEWNAALGNDKVGVVKNASVTAVTGAATSLGGTYEIRVLIDDAVATSKLEVLRALEAISQRIIEDNWVPA